MSGEIMRLYFTWELKKMFCFSDFIDVPEHWCLVLLVNQWYQVWQLDIDVLILFISQDLGLEFVSYPQLFVLFINCEIWIVLVESTFDSLIKSTCDSSYFHLLCDLNH